MIIGVFADVHGNLPALEAVLQDGRLAGVEKWLCLGDIAFRGPAPEECLQIVSELCTDTTVMGNTEEWLPVGPPAGEAPTPERQAAIERWWQWTIQRIGRPEIDWVKGLPHKRLFEFGRERLLCVHATARRASYVILDLIGEGTSVNFRRVPYDVDRTIRLALDREFPWANDYAEALRHGSNF